MRSFLIAAGFINLLVLSFRFFYGEGEKIVIQRTMRDRRRPLVGGNSEKGS